jgi:tRNA threonylcarbamoyladenosine biosynthesis protein TsaB
LAYFLNIETSGLACSVSIAQDTDTKSFRLNRDGQYRHAEVVHTFVEECLKEAGITLKAIDAVGVSAGPGSYTGLRVGVSAAKGYAYALNVPLISAPTLKLMALQALDEQKKNGWSCKGIVPMIDARREEVYLAAYDAMLKETTPTTAAVLTENKFSFNEMLICGNGAEKAKKYFGDNNVYFTDCYASALFMPEVIYTKYKAGIFEDTAYYEPFYLKEFYVKA